MALVCTTPSHHSPRFEFIECGSISISYPRSGLATVGFTVVSSDGNLDGVYTNLTFGGVNFKGPISNVSVEPIAGTTVYSIRISLFAFGC